ncbi:MAG: copper chaperone PCu(A)C [Burkholderiales bacterium]|nr:copper chaperone PCu(A)C [Burkholderiales bacterium]
MYSLRTSRSFGLLVSVLLGASAAAQVTVTEPWVRATVPQQKATGAFMQLKAEQSMRLVAGKSPVAGVVEIHEMAMENGMMKMRQIPGIEIPAGQTLALKPGSYHVMLMDLKQQVKDGDTVPITLEFVGLDNKKHTMEIKAPARPLNAMPGKASGHGEHKH